MAGKDMSLAERAEAAACDALASLTVGQWRALGELAARHTAGQLSAAAWRCATGAIVARGLERAAEEGPVGLEEG